MAISDNQVMNVIIVFLLIGLSLIMLGIVTNILGLFYLGAFIVIVYTISYLYERANKNLRENENEY